VSCKPLPSSSGTPKPLGDLAWQKPPLDLAERADHRLKALPGGLTQPHPFQPFSCVVLHPNPGSPHCLHWHMSSQQPRPLTLGGPKASRNNEDRLGCPQLWGLGTTQGQAAGAAVSRSCAQVPPTAWPLVSVMFVPLDAMGTSKQQVVRPRCLLQLGSGPGTLPGEDTLTLSLLWRRLC
jgi:hypothetical protein